MNNANLTLFDRKKSNDTEEHAVFNFVMREDPVSDELKAEWILPYEIIVYCHLERRTKNSPYSMDRTVTAAFFLLLFDEPQFCIRYPDLVDPCASERVLLQDVYYSHISFCGSRSDIGLGCDILLNQIQNCQIPAVCSDLTKEISLDLLFQFS